MSINLFFSLLITSASVCRGTLHDSLLSVLVENKEHARERHRVLSCSLSPQVCPLFITLREHRLTVHDFFIYLPFNIRSRTFTAVEPSFLYYLRGFRLLRSFLLSFFSFDILFLNYFLFVKSTSRYNPTKNCCSETFNYRNEFFSLALLA